MSKIHKIDIRTTIYWYGKDFPEDYQVASAVSEEICAGNFDLDGKTLTSADASTLSKDVLNSCPWGEDGGRQTIAGWLNHA